MPLQKTIFLEGEGDSYFNRNRKQTDSEQEPIIVSMREIGIRPALVLEIGASSGVLLASIQRLFGAECYGIDPSAKAIEYGRVHYPNINLSRGTADNLVFPTGRFDLVIFGFCLYLCDPADYFRIAQEADRVLRDKGFLIIKDFTSPVPLKGAYRHLPGIFSRKLDWAKMFTWHPAYRLLSRRYIEDIRPYSFHPHEGMAIDVLCKDHEEAFTPNPYA